MRRRAAASPWWETGDGALASALPAVPACAVTHIGPDGSGRSIERLAHDAAAVMRQGTVCVTAPGQPKRPLTEIIVAAGKADCELVVPEEEDITFPEEGEDARVDYGGYEVPPAFPGYHAACNAAIAVELALALWRKGFDIPDEASCRRWLPPRTPPASASCPSSRWSSWMPAAPPSRLRRLLRVLQKRAGARPVRRGGPGDGCRVQRLSSPPWRAASRPNLPPKTAPRCPAWGRAAPSNGCSSPCRRERDPALAQTLADAARFHFEVEVCPACPKRWTLPAPRAAAACWSAAARRWPWPPAACWQKLRASTPFSKIHRLVPYTLS